MVKGLVEYTQFNMNFTILTASLINTLPNYVIISFIVFCFILLIGILGLIFYALRRKYDSIDNHTNRKYSQKDNDPNVYKEDKKEYKQDVSDLGVKILPDGQTIIDFADKIAEFKKKD